MKFFEFAKKGDHSALLNLRAEDSEFWTDGGGEAPVAWTTVQKNLRHDRWIPCKTLLISHRNLG